MQLSENVVIDEIAVGVSSANNTDQNSDVLDMAGYDGVLFISNMGATCTIGAKVLMTAEGSATDATGAALSGAITTYTSVGTDDILGEIQVLNVYKPQLRYINIARTTTTQVAAIGPAFAIRYGGRKAPISDSSTANAVTSVISPALA